MSEVQQAHHTYTPAAVANVFLALAQAEGRSLSNLKMQKLIYFANGLYLASTGVPLVNEKFQAWTYGPVLLSLYSLLRVFRDGPIVVERLEAIDTIFPDTFAYALIQGVWERLKSFSAWQLVQITHRDGSPWHKAIKTGGRFTSISNEDLKEYFSH